MPAWIPGDSYVGNISYDNVVDGNKALITACALLNVQNLGVNTSSGALTPSSSIRALAITAEGIQYPPNVTNDWRAVWLNAIRSCYA